MQATSNSKRRLHAEAGEFKRLGWVWVRCDDAGVLHEVHLPGLMDGGPNPPSNAVPMHNALQRAVEQYEQGQAEVLLQLPLAPAPTPFARQVRHALQKIPKGCTWSYGQVAQLLAKPRAARAVGRACGANPLPLVVPCHRVVAAHGLGGFALGLGAKRALLTLEGFDVAMCEAFR